MSEEVLPVRAVEAAPSRPQGHSSAFWKSLPLPRTPTDRDVVDGMPGAVTDVHTSGIVVHPMTAPEIVNTIALSALTGQRLLLGNHNLHSLHLFQQDAAVRDFYALADRVVIDGTPILWLASRKNPELSSEHRVGSTDWLAELLPVAEEANLRIAFLGGAPGVAETAKAEIVARYPGVRIDVHDGYFDATTGSAENEDVLRWIADVRADVLLVGMGMPRQERWILENHARIEATVVCTVGGCLDYIAGRQRLAPRWLGPLGLEWAFRLLCDPKRLAHRYLIEPQHIARRLAAGRVSRMLRRANHPSVASQ